MIIALPLVYLAIGGADQIAKLPADRFEIFGQNDWVWAMGVFFPTFFLLLGESSMYQKFFSAKDEASARKAVIGMVIGVASAYFGGKFDLLVQRFVDTMMGFPGLVLVLIMVVDIFLARQLSKLINAALTGSAKAAPARVAPPPNAPQLPRPDTAPFLPASSVTENTTRFLESDYRAPVEPQPGEKQNT
jgi:Na+/proline symporter